MSHDYDPKQWLSLLLCCRMVCLAPLSLGHARLEFRFQTGIRTDNEMLNITAGRKNTRHALHIYYTTCPIYYSHQTRTGWYDRGLQHSQ